MVCFTLLEDVNSSVYNADSTHCESEISQSQWFTRGWTLQELIAPQKMFFFNKDWAYLGSKRTLLPILTKATKIPRNVLRNSSFRRSSSVAQKMSWAANRETTRIEDLAYSLLGVFEVNMPLLYGEGERAFIRLQEEIIKESSDQSILAWNPIDDSGMYEEEMSGSVLAKSPKAFAESGNIIPFPSTAGRQVHVIINKGLMIEVPVLKSVSRSVVHHVAILDCHFENDFSGPIGIPMFSTIADSVFVGLFTDTKIAKFSTSQVEDAKVCIIHIVIKPAKQIPRRSQQSPTTCFVRAVLMKSYGYDLLQVVTKPSHESVWLETTKVLQMRFEDDEQFEKHRMRFEPSIRQHIQRSSAAFFFYNRDMKKYCVIMCAVFNEKYTNNSRCDVKTVVEGERPLLVPKVEVEILLGDWLIKTPCEPFKYFDKGSEYEEAKIPTKRANSTIGAGMTQKEILNQSLFVLDIGTPKVKR